VLRFYHHYSSERERLAVISTGILVVLSAGGLALAGAVIVSPHVSQLIFRTPQHALLCSLAIGAGVAELGFLLPGTLLRVREQVRLYTVAAVGKFALAILANVILVVVLRKGVLGVMLANAIAVGAFAIAFTAYTLRRTGVRVSRDAARRLLAYGLPLTAAAIPGLVISTSDRYILMYTHNSQAVGIYALATKFGMILHMLIFEPFTFVYSVFIFKVAATAQSDRTYGRVMTHLFLIGGWVALGLALLSPEAVRIIAGAPYAAAAAMVPPYLLGSFLFGISPMLELGLYLKNKTFWKPAIVAFEAGAIVILNMLLIPRYGGVGAAWAYGISQAIFCAALFAVSRRYVSVSYEWGRLMVLAAVASAMLVIGHALGARWGWGGTGLRALLGLSFPLVLLALRLYSRDETDEALRLLRRLFGGALRPHPLGERETAASTSAAPTPATSSSSLRAIAVGALAPYLEPLIRRASPGVIVLRYHSVFPAGSERDSLVSSTLCVAPEDFDRQMAHLAANYRPLSLDEVVERLGTAEPLPRDGVVVTFDDGYADNHDFAAPILLKHGIPATFFITTGFIDNAAPPWYCIVRHAFERAAQPQWVAPDGGVLPLRSEDDRLRARRRVATLVEDLAAEERANIIIALCKQLEVEPPQTPGMIMSWQQVRQLARLGFSIGAHSVSHPNLARVSADELWREVNGSVRRIAEAAAIEVRHFAYPDPYGKPNFSPAVIEAVRRAGCISACTTRPGAVRDRADAHTMPRLTIYDNNPRTFMVRAMRAANASPASVDATPCYAVTSCA
jgi:O-antigen/teichoic acid export membrane protein/peptidoglycan/xylan/chitin deacetylase (PgdA/CDA1 family)